MLKTLPSINAYVSLSESDVAGISLHKDRVIFPRSDLYGEPPKTGENLT